MCIIVVVKEAHTVEGVRTNLWQAFRHWAGSRSTRRTPQRDTVEKKELSCARLPLRLTSYTHPLPSPVFLFFLILSLSLRLCLRAKSSDSRRNVQYVRQSLCNAIQNPQSGGSLTNIVRQPSTFPTTPQRSSLRPFAPAHTPTRPWLSPPLKRPSSSEMTTAPHSMPLRCSPAVAPATSRPLQVSLAAAFCPQPSPAPSLRPHPPSRSFVRSRSWAPSTPTAASSSSS